MHPGILIAVIVIAVVILISQSNQITSLEQTLQDTISNCTKDKASLDQQLIDLKNKTDADIKELTTSLTNLNKQKEQLTQSYNAQISTLNKQISSWKEKHLNLTNLHNALKSQHTELNRQHNILQSNLSTLTKEHNSVIKQLSITKMDKDALSLQLTDMTSARDSLVKQLSNCKQEKAQLEAQIISLKKSLQDSQATIASLKRQHLVTTKSLQDEITRLTTEKDNLQQQYTAIIKEYEAAKVKHGAQVSELTKKVNDCQRSLNQCFDLEKATYADFIRAKCSKMVENDPTANHQRCVDKLQSQTLTAQETTYTGGVTGAVSSTPIYSYTPTWDAGSTTYTSRMDSVYEGQIIPTTNYIL